MLEIILEGAHEPQMMERQPCGICGAEFEPKAVLAELVTPHEFKPICEACFHHLARRAEEESIPANWDEAYRRYVSALNEYTEPIFPSVEALEEVEDFDPERARVMLYNAAFWPRS